MWRSSIVLVPSALNPGLSIKPRACPCAKCHQPTRSGDPLPPPSQAGITGGTACSRDIYFGSGNPNLDPHACRASLITKSSPPTWFDFYHCCFCFCFLSQSLTMLPQEILLPPLPKHWPYRYTTLHPAVSDGMQYVKANSEA